jgi:hypothetical protein
MRRLAGDPVLRKKWWKWDRPKSTGLRKTIAYPEMPVHYQ